MQLVKQYWSMQFKNQINFSMSRHCSDICIYNNLERESNLKITPLKRENNLGQISLRKHCYWYPIEVNWTQMKQFKCFHGSWANPEQYIPSSQSALSVTTFWVICFTNHGFCIINPGRNVFINLWRWRWCPTLFLTPISTLFYFQVIEVLLHDEETLILKKSDDWMERRYLYLL